jgi:16S rRNA (guanine527-N7)-methyltransferase
MSTEPLPEMSDLWQQTLNWHPTASQQARFQHLYELVLIGNQHQNLTRITEPSEFWEKHLWDSLRGVFPYVSLDGLKVMDIGTGAGFPGFPIAIVRPDWHVTLLDSTRKKVTFLEDAIDALNLKNAKAVVDRVEKIGQHRHHREGYDLATIRAVASPSVCAEYALPLVKVGGLAVLYRGQWTDDEAIALTDAVDLLGGTIEACEKFETPLTHGIRHCVYLRKTRSTPAEFPRAIGIPAQNPL